MVDQTVSLVWNFTYGSRTQWAQPRQLAEQKTEIVTSGMGVYEMHSGWMSLLESEVKPVIECLLDNRMKAVDA